MDRLNTPEDAAWVLRAVSPEAQDTGTGAVTHAAFLLRTSEDNLSVYSSTIQTPRYVLQKIIDGRHAILQAKTGEDRRRYQRWIERRGSTVEQLIELGWKVVKLPLSAFPQDEFEIGAVEPDGH